MNLKTINGSENLIMAKRLYTILSSCRNEEEVKNEFANFFKIRLNTHQSRIDLYTQNALFEFKFNKNLQK